MSYNKVIEFWFGQLDPKDWFLKSDVLDKKIRDNFSDLLEATAKGESYKWRQYPLGRLAEIIVLDQFSRNIYRETARAFSQDQMALTLAQEAVAQGVDQAITNQQKAFLYMPYMHSESLIIHEEAIKLFSRPNLSHNLEYEIKHRDIIAKFGRYPHRNKILGRESTPEEIEFLKTPGSSF
ncbi:MAG: DUF924 domain-containing protein [Bacteriovoracaceae bacterium]|nr:DUF924 domain-containing protein [Bacteriovoracaceae bacterium]